MNAHTALYLQAFQYGAEKTAAEMKLPRQKKPDIKANDIVPMDTFGGGVADYLMPSSRGSHRAGRSEVMGKSVGKRVSREVTRPQTTTMLRTFLMTLGVGLAGGAIGGAGTAMAGGSDDEIATNAMIGGSAGLTAGSLAGLGISGYKRRKEMKGINKAFDEAETVTPYARRGNPLAIAAGGHESGRAEGLAAVLGHDFETPGTQTASSAWDAVTRVPYAGLLAVPGFLASSGIEKHVARRRTSDLVAQALGYTSSGMGISGNRAHIQQMAPAFQN